MATKTTKTATTKTATTKTAAATTVHPTAAAILVHVSKAAGWSVKDDTALSALGTMVRFTAKTAVISNGSDKVVIQLTDQIKPAVQAIINVEQKAKTMAQAAARSTVEETAAPAATTPKPKKEDKKTMPNATTAAPAATGKKRTVPAAPAATTAAPAAPAAPVKPAPVRPVNPAGTATPIFDELKTAFEKTEKADSAIKALWHGIGEKFNFSISPLTKALLAEGLWPAAVDAKGNLKEEDGLQVPAGYKGVYDLEKSKGIKGIGHYVNVAAASFGRVKMEQGKKAAEEAKKSGAPTPTAETPTEKVIAKLILQLETAAQKLPAADLKSWLESSKTMAPILESLMEEKDALEMLK